MAFFDWLRRLFAGDPAGRVERTPWVGADTVEPPSGREETEAKAPSRPRSAGVEGLEIGQFAPLSRDESHAQAKQLGSLWGNPWFGRRDLIPPTSDPRTLLIDRAMVGQGLITPEDLEEIHRVGEEMDKVRPDLAQAEQAAAEAVARSKEEREQIKQQKKAEAAERKRKRAEEIAHRKQTDIVFLGRGVSRGLADRRANVEKLGSRDLPVLATPSDVAESLELPISRLRWLAFHTEAAERTHYVTFTVPKKSGGTRQLSAPHRDMARCQRWILRNILDRVPPHPAAHGFVSGRSTVSGAKQHVGRDVLMNLDLKDFFPTITFPRVCGVFRNLGYSPAAATVLALLCTECPRRTIAYSGQRLHVATGPRALPQGACTSPSLSNLVARRLDSRLAGIAGKLGWRYTRYADDLSFSAEGAAADKAAYLMARVRHIAEDEGFAINGKKTRILRRNAAQTVTGIVVNDRPGVPRKVVRRLRAILHAAQKTGLAAQDRRDVPHFEAWVAGMVAYIKMVNPKQGQALAEALRALEP